MKLEYLTIIFVIIMIPIVIVFSEYINNQITTKKTENLYNSRLFSSTRDAVKAYQLNTINNATSDMPESKGNDIEASTNILFNSLAVNFGNDGYERNSMKEYIPAVVYTMYDGYYVYSPFKNTLTEVTTEVDSNYEDTETIYGTKPYVYYACKYERGTDSFIITYTLDNHITIDGIIGGQHVFDQGYLMDLIDYDEIKDTSLTYDGIEFSSSNIERLTEFIGNNEEDLYYYAKVDGTKFYYHGGATDGDTTKINDDDYIFYINTKGEVTKQILKYKDNEENFLLYYNAIFNNNSGYRYYKRAYEFTNRVMNVYNLGNLTKDNIADEVKYKEKCETEGNIFKMATSKEGIRIQDSNSTFNQHRAEIIKNIINTNLATAISGFSVYSNHDNTIEFKMPKISEDNWNLIVNDICMITFMQGLSIGGKIYNSYAVVPNKINKEYIDENDIYILKSDNTYATANEKGLEINIKKKDDLGFYPGVFKVNLERKMDSRNTNNIVYYYPVGYLNSDSKNMTYLGSYMSIIGSSAINSISYSDMYQYMRGLNSSNNNIKNLKTTYYMALGRERMSLYNVAENGNEIDAIKHYLE